ncbi:MAG: response regulator [Chitinophagaceae bacterium]|nr:response regulator [Chitinophagaceae bacterium]
MKKKILMVDDDLDDREIISDAFKMIEADHLLHFESDGENAIQYVQSQFETGNLPSLIVLDLNMPKLNGAQTLKILKSDPRFENIPVIIFSTSLNDLEKKECLNLGAHSYVIKPVYYKESVETARSFYEISKSPHNK